MENYKMQQHAEHFDRVHQRQVQNYDIVTEIKWLANRQL